MTKILKEVVQLYPGVKINSTGRIVLSEHPNCLFHYKDTLRAYDKDSKDTNVKSHMRLYLQYMAKTLDRGILAYNTMDKNAPSERSQLGVLKSLDGQ